MLLADHLLAVALLLLLPLYGHREFQRLVAALERGERDARVQAYRWTIALHVGAGLVPLVIWMLAGRPLETLGLSVPGGVGFGLAVGAAALVTAFFAWQSRMVGRSPEAQDLLRRQIGRLEKFLPHTARELSLFSYVCVTAGIFEELLYRGFLIWYAAQLMPVWSAIVVTSAAFGMAHFYQGIGGVVKTGAAGLVLAGLYVLSGSLWVPMVLHWLMDLVQGRMLHGVLRPPVYAASDQPSASS